MLAHREPLTLESLAAVTGIEREELREGLAQEPASARWVLASSLETGLRFVPWTLLDMALLGELEHLMVGSILTRDQASQVYRDVQPKLPGIWQSICAMGHAPEQWAICSIVDGQAFLLTFAQAVAEDVYAAPSLLQ